MTEKSETNTNQKKSKEERDQTHFPEQYYADPFGLERYVVQEKSLYEWLAPSKIEQGRTRNELIQYTLLFVLVSLITLLISGVLAFVVVMVGSIVLFLTIFSPAAFLQCKISTIGIKVEETYYYWQNLSQYWFEERKNSTILYFRTIYPKVGIHHIVIPNDEKENVMKKIGTYLLYKKPQETSLTKWWSRLKEHFPIELDF